MLPRYDSRSRLRRNDGLTLVEIMVAAGVLAIVSAGLLSVLIQSRRLTEGSIYQNSAVTAVQGYLEQMKNMEFHEIPYYDGATLRRGTLATTENYDNHNAIHTRLDNDTPDHLKLSGGTIPTTSAFRAALATAQNEIQSGGKSRTSAITIPGFESTAVDNIKIIDINNTDPEIDDLILHVWVWISPLDSVADGISAARAITIVYSWMYNDGGRIRSGIDSVRTIRSAVPTF